VCPRITGGILSQGRAPAPQGVLALEETRERLAELIKMMPEDKLQLLLEFANRLYEGSPEGDEPDDELLMT